MVEKEDASAAVDAQVVCATIKRLNHLGSIGVDLGWIQVLNSSLEFKIKWQVRESRDTEIRKAKRNCCLQKFYDGKHCISSSSLQKLSKLTPH